MDYKKFIFYFIIAVTFFRLLYINFIPLLGDEAYYWQWSRHLDLSYYEQGPVLSIIIYLFTFFNKINTLFTIRLGAVILSMLTMFLCVLIYNKIFPENNKGSFFNLLFINSSLIFSAGAILMMHDTVMVFFYTLLIYVFLFVIEKPENTKNWIFAGIIYGIAIMSKFTIILIYPALFLFFLLRKNFKKYISGFIIFTLITLISFTPVFIWNYTHNWANIKYLIIRSGDNKIFTFKYLFEYFAGQIALLNPLLYFFLIFSAFKNLYQNEQKKFLSFIFIIPQIIFIYLSLKNKIEANWPAFSYMPVFFLATDYLINTKGILKKFVHLIYGFGFFISIIIFIIILIYPKLNLSASNALAKSMGYNKLALEINNLYNNVKQTDRVFIAARHYQIASLLSFYLPRQPMVYILIENEAAKNYRFWNDYKKFNDYNCIFIYEEEWERNEMSKFFSDCKKEIKVIDINNRKFFVDYFIKYNGL